MLGQVFHLDRVKATQSAVQCHISEVNAADLHTLQQLTAEVQTTSRRCHSTLLLGIDRLETLHVFFLCRTPVHNIAGQRGFTQSEELLFELVVRTVIEETQGTSTTGGIVNHLSHHRPIFLKEEFVTDTDLTCRLHQHIPQTQVWVQLTQQEYFYLGIRFLLRTIQTCREHLRIVEDKGIILIEVIQDVPEVQIDGLPFLIGQVVTLFILLCHLDLSALTVYHHQSAFIAMETWLKCHLLLRKLKLKL